MPGGVRALSSWLFIRIPSQPQTRALAFRLLSVYP